MAATTTVLTARPTTAPQHAAVTLTATVSAPTATGTVAFYNGPALIGTVTLDGVTGIASIARERQPVGTAAWTAVYSGDGNWATSTSAGVTVTITKQSMAHATAHPYPENDPFVPAGTLDDNTTKAGVVADHGDQAIGTAGTGSIRVPHRLTVRKR